jgi:hypothetical protein
MVNRNRDRLRIERRTPPNDSPQLHLVLLRTVRAPLVILAMMLFAHSAHSADADRKPLDEDSLRGYMAGEYDLIGRKPDSTATYSRHVTLRDENGVLQVTRTIDGKTDKCIARFDTVAGEDRIPVLRLHFHFDGKEYDATYRWQSDPDNYPRFTGPNRLGSKRFSQSTNNAALSR